MASQVQDVVRGLGENRPIFHLGRTANWNALEGTLGLIGNNLQPGDRTLEVGCGASTVVFAAAGTRHTALSWASEEHRAVREYCASHSIDSSNVTFIEGLSDRVLPDLDVDVPLDFGFIDGGHSFPLPVIDWYYVGRGLRVGGLLLLDDVPIPSVGVVFRFLEAAPDWELIATADDRSALFRKTAEPPADDSWIDHPFNARYPDYSFLPRPKRLRKEAGTQAARLKSSLADRFPSLRRLKGGSEP